VLAAYRRFPGARRESETWEPALDGRATSSCCLWRAADARGVPQHVLCNDGWIVAPIYLPCETGIFVVPLFVRERARAAYVNDPLGTVSFVMPSLDRARAHRSDGRSVGHFPPVPTADRGRLLGRGAQGREAIRPAFPPGDPARRGTGIGGGGGGGIHARKARGLRAHLVLRRRRRCGGSVFAENLPRRCFLGSRLVYTSQNLGRLVMIRK
jgi:hypothetical protein